MEKAFIKPKNYILNISMLVIAVNLLVILFASPIYRKIYTNMIGSNLREFAIINEKLDSVTEFVMGNIMADEETRKHYSLALELDENKDTINFVYYTCGDKQTITSSISHIINVYGRRVIGFIHKDECDIYLLTNISNASDVWGKIGNLVKPLPGKCKYFENIYY